MSSRTPHDLFYISYSTRVRKEVERIELDRTTSVHATHFWLWCLSAKNKFDLFFGKIKPPNFSWNQPCRASSLDHQICPSYRRNRLFLSWEPHRVTAGVLLPVIMVVVGGCWWLLVVVGGCWLLLKLLQPLELSSTCLLRRAASRLTPLRSGDKPHGPLASGLRLLTSETAGFKISFKGKDTQWHEPWDQLGERSLYQSFGW